MANGSTNQDMPQCQLSSTDRNTSIESQVKNLVSGLQSQDMFGSNTPVRSKLKENRRNKQTNKTKRQQNVFTPEQSAGHSTDPAQVKETEEDIDELPQSGQQLLTVQPNPINSPIDSEGAMNSNKEAITNLLKQFINNKGNDLTRETDRAKAELRELYIQQMRKRDRAERNLNNINAAKQKTGRVPNGMQIKVVPEVPDNEQVIFKHKWAIAITEAEKLLSTCIEDHLKAVIKTVDENIKDKMIATSNIVARECEGNPMDQIEATLTDANNERVKINENIKKRKREASESNKGAPPLAKKTRKED